MALRKTIGSPGIETACEGCAQEALTLYPGHFIAAPLDDWADSLATADEQIAAAMRPRLSASVTGLPPAIEAAPAVGSPQAAVTGQLASAPHGRPADHGAAGWVNGTGKKAIAWLSVTGTSIVTGIVLALAGHPGNPYSNSALIGLGAALIVLPILAGIIAVIVKAVRDAMRAHREWFSQFPPEQQERIQRAERAAAWGALAVGEVAFHEHVRHSREQHAAQYQARTAASQARSAAFDAQERHQELLDAVQQQGQPAGPQLYGGRCDVHGRTWQHDLQGNWQSGLTAAGCPRARSSASQRIMA